jgi:hypothetical protein
LNAERRSWTPAANRAPVATAVGITVRVMSTSLESALMGLAVTAVLAAGMMTLALAPSVLQLLAVPVTVQSLPRAASTVPQPELVDRVKVSV